MEKLSELEWLSVCIGPQRLDENLLYPLTIIYIVMGITGILGNIMVCIVITRNISMRTSTNFFLLHLAIADLIILLIVASFDLYVYWQQYPWLLGDLTCRLRAFLAEMSVFFIFISFNFFLRTCYSSVLTILAFSCERFLAICHPI